MTVMALAPFRRRLGPFAVAGLLLLLTVPPVAAVPPHTEFEEQQAAMEELAALEGDEFEIAYINSIIAHHMAALDMSELVHERAPHQEVRADAAQIIADQQAEIELLTTYLQDTHSQEPDPDERMLMSEAMMAHLRDATPEMAEVMFLLMMREHHQMAIEMGEMALEKGVSDTLADQAQMMVDSQREEQERFAGYLGEWYGIEAPEPTGDAQAAMEFGRAEMGAQPNTAVDPASLSPVPLLTASGIVLLLAAGVAAIVGRGRVSPAGGGGRR